MLATDATSENLSKKSLIMTIVFFLGVFFNVGEVVIQPYEDFAKFDYNLDMKVKIFKMFSIFLAICWNLL